LGQTSARGVPAEVHPPVSINLPAGEYISSTSFPALLFCQKWENEYPVVSPNPDMKQKRSPTLQSLWLLPLLLAVATAQTPSNQPAVSYASVNELNGLLAQLDQTSQAVQAELSNLRIDHWKTDANTKRQTQADVESIQRNLKGALPTIVGELRASPESAAASFKLYRNLDALYDVFSSVVESGGAFGPKDEFQSLENNLGAIENLRRSLGQRMDTLLNAKDTELVRLRTQVQAAQTAASSAPPRKVIVDDTEAEKKPVKKSVKKKPVPKPPVPKPAASQPGAPAVSK
jgi:hypothetical protein